MKLVIAEKPSVGAAIAAVMGANEKRSGYFEGGGYLVSWCIGHLISLADAATYNEQFRKWKYDDLPIVPQEWQFIVASGKEQQFSILKDLMHRSDVTEIINACDSGREGELIFRFVYEQANCKKPFSRLWISSMEASAIREGFSNLKDGRGYDNLYQSALCRAKADWLIGINATRLFSILYHKTLNVGRVQTPTLAMLVNRDYAISSFKKEKYHVVRLDVGGVAALSERQDDEAAARQMKAACEKSQAVCTSLKKEKKTAAPPKLFDLTALQREANRLYGFTAKQTLDYAQALYEKRLLTYPRTDSKYITSDMEGSTKELITGLCAALPFMQGVKLQADLARICDNSKVTDHHAILPTAEFVKTGFSSLAESEKKLMTLVCAKLLCAVAAPYEYEAVTAVFTCGGYTFTAKGSDSPADFMRGIEEMTAGLVKTYSAISEDKAKLFTPQREAIGTCPRCGAAVYEGKKNFYCSDRACSFVMWKNDRFFEQRKKAFTKAIAAALLKDGKVKIKGMYSTKTGKTFDGVVLLADTGGKYVNFRVEQNRK